MKQRYINAFLLILIVLAVAFYAQYVGNRYVHKYHEHSKGHSDDMHKAFHEKLNITTKQEKKLADSEIQYRERQKYLEEKMQLANMELANAIRENDSYSVEVQEAVDKIHHAMGELQKATLEHLFEMRAVLTPEQNEKLKQLIADALYQNAKDK